ncbi:hypothetical protein ACH5RR_028429 [Cinchona calisaya]|uniref:Uncharacterized protein n=1 Tax=Cinchona calisaya TaxID=153742 RepID=A0ABD2YU27_9GENT
MAEASIPVNSVLHDMELLQSNLQKRDSFRIREDFETLKLNLQFLKTFLLCSRKWSNYNHQVFLESPIHDNKVCRLPSFLLTIQDSANKFRRDIQSLRHRSENDDLVDFLDSVLQNLDYIVQKMVNDNRALWAQVESLEDTLTFLKSFIGFAKLFCRELHQLEDDPLTHIQFVALNIGRISYTLILSYNTSFMVSVKGQLQILYEGLRFFRSIPRKQREQMNELDGKIVTVLSEAGILICPLYVNEVNVDSSSVIRDSMKPPFGPHLNRYCYVRPPCQFSPLHSAELYSRFEPGCKAFCSHNGDAFHQLSCPKEGFTDSHDCYAMLVNTNCDFKLIENQNTEVEILIGNIILEFVLQFLQLIGWNYHQKWLQFQYLNLLTASLAMLGA